VKSSAVEAGHDRLELDGQAALLVEEELEVLPVGRRRLQDGGRLLVDLLLARLLDLEVLPLSATRVAGIHLEVDGALLVGEGGTLDLHHMSPTFRQPCRA